MKWRHWLVASIIGLVVVLLAVALREFVVAPVVLQPSGPVGNSQRDLFFIALFIMSLVVIPVFVLLFYIAWKYKATNKKAKYTPEWESNKKLETIWWGIPILVVGVLSVIAYQTAHTLDPFRPLDSKVQPLQVQVVALQWKWLFIYPSQNAASVNELVIPVSTPVEFAIAADSPMNSFWIPELGGQIYAMNGMTSKLHLQADKAGTFKGVSSNLSGEGFADMKFNVRSVERKEFNAILSQKSRDSQALDMSSYDSLAVPSTITEPQWYRLADKDLHKKIVDKYMLPANTDQGYDEDMQNMSGGAH
jgi:cytochrome o ubiquinol oxidase subunit 2